MDTGVHLSRGVRIKTDHCLEFTPDLTTHTDDPSLECSTDSDEPDVGSWFYPNGSAVVFDADGLRWLYQQRSTGAVTLYHDKTQNALDAVEGIYSCVIPSEDGDVYTLRIGIYTTCSKYSLLIVLVSF